MQLRESRLVNGRDMISSATSQASEMKVKMRFDSCASNRKSDGGVILVSREFNIMPVNPRAALLWVYKLAETARTLKSKMIESVKMLKCQNSEICRNIPNLESVLKLSKQPKLSILPKSANNVQNFLNGDDSENDQKLLKWDLTVKTVKAVIK